MSDKRAIEARENGPFVAKHIRRMEGPDGEDIGVKATMALCRCGHSGTKPYCDGTHWDEGWTAE
ncbi:hypothetical protein A3731_40695 [Roseovarius sp. HI0049]|nr:hypothetical protein A3731_26650 [Roseovarius sp. HI0049]KZY38191.1 hypothetical protein A3731_40695 [Roseovarius sp. HI0049]